MSASKIKQKSSLHKCQSKKAISLRMVDLFNDANLPDVAEKMKRCATYLELESCPSGHERHLKGSNFCRKRLCPMCEWRKSLRSSQDLLKVCHYVSEDNPSYRYLFLTLTIPNVKGENLPGAITGMMKAFDRMRNIEDYKKAVKGHFRSLEVTYNLQRDDYHPHFHVLLCVPPGYFSKYYIPKARWLEMWQDAMRDKSITQVDIRKVGSKKGISGAVTEVAKYSTKVKDVLDKGKLSDDDSGRILKHLYEGLQNRRLQAYAGILKEYKSLLGVLEADAKDSNLGDDLREDCKCSVCSSELVDEIATWGFGRYHPKTLPGRLERAVEREWLEELEYAFEETLAILSEDPESIEEKRRLLRTRLPGLAQDGSSGEVVTGVPFVVS